MAFKWFEKKPVSPPTRPTPPAPPAQPDWQAQWHDIYDGDPASEGPRPDPLPDLDGDFRLIHAFWTIAPETRAAALALLPRGDEIAARVERWRAQEPVSMSAEQAEAKLREGLADLAWFGVDHPAPDCRVEHLGGDTPAYLAAFSAADAVTLALDDRLVDMARTQGGAQGGALGEAAWRFLGYPLGAPGFQYWRHWMAWPLVAPEGAPDVYAVFSDLVRAGRVPGWRADGSVVLFERAP